MLTLLSWNVNGIRAVTKRGFAEWLADAPVDMLGLQEIKSDISQVPEEVRNPAGFQAYWNPAKRPGYSGTALFSRIKPLSVETGFGIERFDSEGRIIIARYEKFFLFNIYFPNGQRDDERLQYKMSFYDEFLKIADSLKKNGENLVICGDFNTAHKEIDLTHPKANENRSGFLPIEREWMDKFVAHGYVDTFRHIHGDVREQYSWWSWRANARANNVGWRIDYFFVNQEFLPALKDAFILQEVEGADHCPVGIQLDV